MFFTPSADGAYYISAGAFQDNVGTYKVSVREVPARTDDYAQDNTTTGTVAVGGTTRGNFQFSNDRDWFAVALEAGKAYQIDLRNIVSGDGYVDIPVLHGIHDADGTLIDGIPVIWSDDYRLGTFTRMYFTPSADGTYYIAAGAHYGTGLYEVAVSEMGEDDYTGHSGTGTGTVAVDGSATGNIQFTGDRDWFAVTLKAAEGGYQIDLKGSDSGGGTLRDPYLRGIYDADGTLINGTANNNLPGGEGIRDSQVIFTPSTDGTYYVAAGAVDGNVGTYTVAVTGVDDHAGNTTTTSTIRVGEYRIGDIQFAGDQDWFKVTLEAGELYRIFQKGGGPNRLQDPYLRGIHDADGTFIDGTENDDSHDNDSPLFKRSEVIFTPSTDGTYYVAAGAAGDHLGDYFVDVRRISDDYADDSTTTGAIAVGGSATGGNIQFVSDHDWFAVALEGGKTYQIEQKAHGNASLSDPYLYGIHDSSGTLIDGTANNDRDESSRDSKVTFTPDADGTYYVAAGAYHYGSYEGRFGTYQVSVTEEDTM